MPTTNGTRAGARQNGYFVEVGTTGFDVFNDQNKVLPNLAGKAAIDVFREMAANDAVIGSILFAVDMLLRQVEWTVTPAEPESTPATPMATTSSTPTTAEEAAEFVGSCLEDMCLSWEDTLSQVMSMLVFGWSYHEIVYKHRIGPQDDPNLQDSKFSDGKIGWRKFAIRAQETLDKWVFDPGGGIQGMVQLAPPLYRPVFIPIEKALLFRTSTHNNSPEGRSVLRNAYRAWWLKKRIEEIEGIGIERDLAGLPKAFAPARWLSEAGTEQERAAGDAIKKMVKNVKRDENEGVTLPSVFDDKGNRLVDLELLATQGRRNFDTDAIISRYDQREAMTVLADFILLGHEKVGSYSLGASKVDLFQVALGAWLDSISDIFNSHAVPRLMRLNGYSDDVTPTLEHSKIESIDLGILGEYVSKLAGAGILLAGDVDTENHLRRVAGIPESEGAEAL